MEQVKSFVHYTKEKAVESWQAFLDDLYRDQKKTIFTLIGGILFALIFAGLIVFSHYVFASNDLQATEYEVVFDGTRTPIVSDHFGIKVVFASKTEPN